MKKFSKPTLIIHLILSISIFSACGDDDDKDTVAPVITLLKPETSDRFIRGGVITINANVSDNEKLKEMELSLSVLKSAKGIDTPWTPEIQKIPLNGKEQQIRNIIAFSEIPNDIMSGTYTLSIKVNDLAGNTVKTSVNITIE